MPLKSISNFTNEHSNWCGFTATLELILAKIAELGERLRAPPRSGGATLEPRKARHYFDDVQQGGGKKKKGLGENEFLPPPSPPCLCFRRRKFVFRFAKYATENKIELRLPTLPPHATIFVLLLISGKAAKYKKCYT